MSLYDPRNRKELFLRGVLDGEGDSLPDPQTREEIFLKAIAQHTADYYGAPLTASTVAGMTDQSRVYVYTGSEAGYTAGNWYYWNGTAWTSGGVYNSIAIQTDKTLTVEDMAADAKATGDRIGFTESFLYSKEAPTLPGNVAGDAQFKLNASGDCMVSGTANVAELFDLAQGTFTVNSVTVTVSGNTVTMSGQPSTNFQFHFKTGTAKTTIELTNETLNLPVHLYTLSQKVTSGTVFPSIAIRSKSSGNVVTSQNNTQQFTMDPTTCGGFYAVMQSSKNYSCTFKIALMPFVASNTNPHRETDSDVTLYDVDGVYSLNGYTWVSGSPTVYILKSKIPRSPLVKYSTRSIPYTGANKVIDVYIPSRQGYINYIFGHTTSPGEYGDVWRLIQIDSVDDYMNINFHVTQLGETEMALKINGRSDFIGGFTHGDETYIAADFGVLLDGGNVDPTTLTDLTPFKTLKIFSVNNMFDPNDHVTNVGTHGIEWLFDSTGLYLSQTIIFGANLTLTSSYLPMICAIRGNDTVSTLQITDTYRDDGELIPYDVGTAGFTTYPNQLKQGIKMINLYGKTSKLDITLELIEQPEGLTGNGNYVFNQVNTYNKIYNCICGYNNTTQTVSIGDKWKVKCKINVEVG